MASQGDFLSTYTGLAQDIGNATGLKPEVILGQIAQETGFGDHVKGNNIFGISPGGNVASYPSVQDAANSYIQLINSRYPNARAGQTAAAQASGLVHDGYNTVDKTYAPKVAGLASTFAPIINQPAQPNDQPAGDTDSFEKQYGLNGKSPAAPVDTAAPDADFEAKYGLNKAAPAEQPIVQPPNTSATTSEYGDLAAQPWAQGTTPSPTDVAPVAAAVQAIPTVTGNTLSGAVQGAKEGFGSGPLGIDGLTPAMQKLGVYPPAAGGGTALQSINQAGIGGAAALGDLAARTGSALFRGVQGGLSEIPVVGRDLAAIPEAFAGDAGGLAMHGEPVPVERPGVALSQATHDRLDAPLPANFKANPGQIQANSLSSTAPSSGIKFALPAQAPEFVPAAAPAAPSIPTHFTGAAISPADQGANRIVNQANPATGAANMPAKAAGAQASTDAEATMTPAEVQANRSVAEIKRLTDSQPEGKDTNQYVPGVTASEAEMEQSANSAREQKQLESAIPQPFKDAQRVNNDARKDYFAQTAGSAIDVKNAIEERSAQAEADLNAAFGNKKSTDAQPVVDTINNILTNPRDSENTAVQQYVKPFLDRMANADGTLKSDPEQLYGIREDVARMQSKSSRAQTPTLDHVTGQLQQVKDALDGVIENGASGYQQYLKNFSDASKPIDTMQLLQEYEPKIVNTNGTMTYSGIKKMMRDIVIGRAGKGLDPAKSIPQETMDKLWNIHDDLRRTAASQELAKARGSDTAQNLMDMVKHGISHVGWGIAHGVAGHASPIVGNIIVHGAKAAVERRAGIKSQAALTNRAAAMANPNPLSYPAPISATGNILSANR